jgi:hypothetical protein
LWLCAGEIVGENGRASVETLDAVCRWLASDDAIAEMFSERFLRSIAAV